MFVGKSIQYGFFTERGAHYAKIEEQITQVHRVERSSRCVSRRQTFLVTVHEIFILLFPFPLLMTIMRCGRQRQGVDT